MTARIRVYVESGEKKVFASALDWPGWSRGARDEKGALEALVAYGGRYAEIVAGVADYRPPGEASDLEVTERLKGGGATDFGVQSLPASSDEEQLSEAEIERLEALLQACWQGFDRIARHAEGVELRKGPRGGGRDLPKMVEHLVGAEEGYLRQLGARPGPAGNSTAAGRWPALREAILAAFRARANGEEPDPPTKVKRRWSPRYFVRRASWHLLDHAWEIEDRRIRGPGRPEPS